MHGSLHRNQKAQKDVAPEAVWGGGGDFGEACLGVRLMKFETFSFAALFSRVPGGVRREKWEFWDQMEMEGRGGGKRRMRKKRAKF